MTKPSTFIGMTASLYALAAIGIVLPLSEADAQRRGGGGHQVRSSASSNLNLSGRGASSQRSHNSTINNGNRGSVSTGDRNSVIKGNNINTGDINIDRNVDIDVDHGWGCCGYNGWDYHPVAAGVAVGTAVAVANAWRVGAYYNTLPTNCVITYRGAVTYYQCGTYWYQPVYSGMAVQYVAVVAPK